MHLCNGDTFNEAYNQFKDNTQLVAIGINCTSPFHVTALLKSAKKSEITLSSKPFIVYPNDGRLWDGVTQKFIETG